jgi:hypothetical protein
MFRIIEFHKILTAYVTKITGLKLINHTLSKNEFLVVKLFANLMSIFFEKDP